MRTSNSKNSPPTKVLALEAGEAEVVIAGFLLLKARDFAPEHRARLPSLMRALGRFQMATASELRSELAQLRKEHKPDHYAPAEQQTIDLATMVAEAQAVLRGERSH
jgi:hypothetical protein